MREVLSVWKKNRLVMLRAYPFSFIIDRLVMGIFTVLFPYITYKYLVVYQNSEIFLESANTSDYITYVVLGGAALSLGYSTIMHVGKSFMNELREGTLEPMLIIPFARWKYILGCFLQQLDVSLIEFTVVLLFGGLLGAKLTPIFSVGAAVAIVLLMLSFLAISVMLASFILYSRETYIVLNTVYYLISLLTGILFPIEFLPKPLFYVAQCIPLTHSLKLFRRIIINESAISNEINTLFMILLTSFVFMSIGYVWYLKIEVKLNEEIFG